MPPRRTRSGSAPAASSGTTTRFFQRHSNVYAYVPNIIGYARVLLAAAALRLAFDDVPTSLALYALSFVCDELDGRFARMFDQCSEFGKLLDMVTDRLATTGLLMVVSREYPNWFFTCVSLVALDIGSHWLQMYAQILRNKSSHKDVDEGSFFILRLYYTNRIFMGACCVGAEVLYLAAHAATDPRILAIAGPLAGALPAKVSVPLPAVLGWGKELGVECSSALAQLALVALPFWAVKQAANVAQLVTSCEALVAHDFPKRKRA
mmetsp:Transcript_1373/g.5978  ORF Transcript_1373/g.5978 Transcript_1373/m.5978 type:complete len:264 (+) Transcript_1373:50-841(+)